MLFSKYTSIKVSVNLYIVSIVSHCNLQPELLPVLEWCCPSQRYHRHPYRPTIRTTKSLSEIPPLWRLQPKAPRYFPSLWFDEMWLLCLLCVAEVFVRLQHCS